MVERRGPLLVDEASHIHTPDRSLTRTPSQVWIGMLFVLLGSTADDYFR